MENEVYKTIANLAYEIGSLRRIPRSHRQTLMVNDTADNIGSHSHRVACIAFILAKMEGVDPYKTAMMALFHDVPEVRSGDQNWVHKRYVKVDEQDIINDQFGNLPFSDIGDFLFEYHERQSLESLVAKDADLIDQVLLLKEYEWQGNKEATVWLGGKKQGNENRQISNIKTQSGKHLVQVILNTSPSVWWEEIWTDKNK